MTKSFLDSLIKCFSVYTSFYSPSVLGTIKIHIRMLLEKDLPNRIIDEYLSVFNTYLYDFQNNNKDNCLVSKNFITKITRNLNQELSIELRFQFIIKLLFFNKLLIKLPKKDIYDSEFCEHKLSKEIASHLNINTNIFEDIDAFINQKLFKIKNHEKLLVIGERYASDINIKFIIRKKISGQVFLYKIPEVDFFLFYYKGNAVINLDKTPIFKNLIYILQSGSTINGDHFKTIPFNEITRKYNLINTNEQLTLNADNLEFRFKNSKNGIHQLTINVESGQLIGILGKSGTGKSTLINLLSGLYKPKCGSVKINNIDIVGNKDKIKGIIGFIPQDDLLINELTVFQNLYINTKLCFGNISIQKIKEHVLKMLKELKLEGIQDLKVGSALNKYISGGQRKRLNIALELIREPWILFADEPTSGLSAVDADTVINILSNQTILNRIVFINIHQPSSSIYKKFDRILILDDSGYPIYFGNPTEAIYYFNNIAGKIDQSTDICNLCGNVNHESIFNVIYEKRVDYSGNLTEIRKKEAVQWHGIHKKKISKKPISNFSKLPQPKATNPNPIKQFIYFFQRNYLTKLTNQAYILLALLVSPALALILGFLSKSGTESNGSYCFSMNENLPVYLFMSVLVGLFIGLIISADEIHKDRSILKREHFIHLNKNSYILSKLAFLFIISLIQSFSFTLISVWILEIKGMFIPYWIVIFSTFCFSNTLGILISMLFKSIVVIYILVPLLIIPQILLSGTVVKYDNLNEKVITKEFTPIIGDLMVSRWANEALVVSHFKNNNYQKHFFQIEKSLSNVKYKLLFLIPELESLIEKKSSDAKNLKEIESGFSQLNQNNLAKLYFNPNNISNTISELEKLKIELSSTYSSLRTQKDSVMRSLILSTGSTNNLTSFKNKHHSQSIERIVLSKNNFTPIISHKNKLIRNFEPIYQTSSSNLGRTNLYTSHKNLFDIPISTPLFNLLIIWIFTTLLIFSTIIFFNKKYKS